LATPPPPLPLNAENGVTQIQDVVDKEQYTEPIIIYLPNANLSNHFDQDILPGHGNSFPNHPKTFAHPSTSPNINFRDEPSDDRTNIAEFESTFIHTLLNAQWFDHTGEASDTCSFSEASQIAKQIVHDLRVEASSKETFLIKISALVGGSVLQASNDYFTVTRLESAPGENEKMFLARSMLRYGAVEAAFERVVSIPRNNGDGEGVEDDGDGEDAKGWKKRYLELRQRMKERDEKVNALRRTVLEALVVSQEFGL
jgi:hypothetical protein